MRTRRSFQRGGRPVGRPPNRGRSGHIRSRIQSTSRRLFASGGWRAFSAIACIRSSNRCSRRHSPRAHRLHRTSTRFPLPRCSPLPALPPRPRWNRPPVPRPRRRPRAASGTGPVTRRSTALRIPVRPPVPYSPTVHARSLPCRRLQAPHHHVSSAPGRATSSPARTGEDRPAPATSRSAGCPTASRPSQPAAHRHSPGRPACCTTRESGCASSTNLHTDAALPEDSVHEDRQGPPTPARSRPPAPLPLLQHWRRDDDRPRPSSADPVPER